MHGEVIEHIQLTPNLVRIVLGGDGLAGFTPSPFTDQYVNVLFVRDGAPYAVPFDVEAARNGAPEHRPLGRRFTIRSWDPATQRIAIDFVSHGDVGFAGRWASSAKPGDLLQFEGPAGAYSPSPTADWHLLVGDESALPAIAASLERIRPGVPALVVAIVDDEDHELPLWSPGDLHVTWVHRSDGERGGSLLAAVESLDVPRGEADVFVHGEAGEVRAVRRHLLAARGVPRDGASISPYWRRQFTDEAWREVKSAWLTEVQQDV